MTLLLGVKVKNLRGQKGYVSNSLDLSLHNPWPFWHPPTASYAKPPGMALLTEARGWGKGKGWLCSSVFCHELVNLFHVFLHRWNPRLVCLACHHDTSCSLQTICRCWTYFRSVYLDWHDTVGETSLKLSKAVPGEALAWSRIVLSDRVCFWTTLLLASRQIRKPSG